MRLRERVEYDPDLDTLTVSGVNYSQKPYTIEIVGGKASLWAICLRPAKYSRRTMGPQFTREDDDAFTKH